MTTRSEVTATLVPALLLCGAALGPHGLAVLTPPVLAFLDPATPVALAVFGILAAMRIETEGSATGSVAAAALV